MATKSLPKRIVLDNSVISAFHEAESLSRVLGFWPGRWIVPLQVRDEAAAWKVQGPAVVAILDSLAEDSVVEFASVEPLLEGPAFVRLQRTLGQGESATIAIAFHRKLWVAIDDRRARRECDELSPKVPWIATEGLLGLAVTGGFLTRSQAELVWAATNIRDPQRRIP